jgi:hypothetical protein
MLSIEQHQMSAATNQHQHQPQRGGGGAAYAGGGAAPPTTTDTFLVEAGKTSERPNFDERELAMKLLNDRIKANGSPIKVNAVQAKAVQAGCDIWKNTIFMGLILGSECGTGKTTLIALGIFFATMIREKKLGFCVMIVPHLIFDKVIEIIRPVWGDDVIVGVENLATCPARDPTKMQVFVLEMVGGR